MTGTLGVLRSGAEQGLVNVLDLLERLKDDQLLSGRDAFERGLRPVAEAIARGSFSPQSERDHHNAYCAAVGIHHLDRGRLVRSGRQIRPDSQSRGAAGATAGRVPRNRIMVRRRSGPPPIRSTDTDLARALEAMTAPELRAFVRAVLDEFEDEQRGRVIDSLMTREARGDAGWKPIVRRPESLTMPGRSRTPLNRWGTPIRTT